MSADQKNAPDTRSKNKYFAGSDVRTYMANYAAELERVLTAIEGKPLEEMLALLDLTREKRKTVWVAGNGGSFAIAEHLCCDWTKGLQHSQKHFLKVQSLCSNGPLTSAISNDLSYGQVFSEQLKMFCEKDDVVILISSSGNSENVVLAAEMAHAHGMKVVSMTGFSGGKLREVSDISVHIPFSNYGIVEDAHQIVMHVLAQFSYLKDLK